MKLKLADTNVRMWKNETSKRTKRSFKGLHLSLKTMAREKQGISYPFIVENDHSKVIINDTFQLFLRTTETHMDIRTVSHHLLNSSCAPAWQPGVIFKHSAKSKTQEGTRSSSLAGEKYLHRNAHLPERRPPIITGDHEFHSWKDANGSG